MITFARDVNGHEKMVWVGFVAVVGIIAFFFMERALTMIAEWRKKRQKKERVGKNHFILFHKKRK